MEKYYNLSSIEGINSIPNVKNPPKAPGAGVTGQIEYYLLHKAAEYEKSDYELAIACYRKANQLMLLSSTIYDKNYYLRLPRFLRKIRRFDEAREEEAKIEEIFPNLNEGKRFFDLNKEDEIKKRRNKLAEQAARTEYKLVEADYIRCVCAECAKYRERVYCINGENKRYPTLPDHLLDPTHDCGITLFPVIENVSSMSTRDDRNLVGHALEMYSNRPFIDDRSPAEIRDYQNMLAEKEAQKEAARKSAMISAEYDWLWEFMPDICQKSLSSYSRMKKQNTVNYQKIKVQAAANGYILT